MSQLPTWWYRTEHFWLEYPHWQMTPLIKRYYLMQLAYWIQQLFVLVLRLEKPRKDFTELVIHHLVTIWLVGWSYVVNLTYIGNAVFLTMDVSDIFLAVSVSFRPFCSSFPVGSPLTLRKRSAGRQSAQLSENGKLGQCCVCRVCPYLVLPPPLPQHRHSSFRMERVRPDPVRSYIVH